MRLFLICTKLPYELMDALSRKVSLEKTDISAVCCEVPSMNPFFHHFARTPCVSLPLPKSPLLLFQARRATVKLFCRVVFTHLSHLSYAHCRLYLLYQPHLPRCLAKQNNRPHLAPCACFSEFELCPKCKQMKCVFLIPSDTMG